MHATHPSTKPASSHTSQSLATLPDKQFPQQIDDFLLVHEVPNQGGWGPVHVIDHYLNMTGGDHKMLWEVPALKNQRYATPSTSPIQPKPHPRYRACTCAYHSTNGTTDATASTSAALRSPTSASRRTTRPRTPI
jgi:hypothetical protein